MDIIKRISLCFIIFVIFPGAEQHSQARFNIDAVEQNLNSIRFNVTATNTDLEAALVSKLRIKYCRRAAINPCQNWEKYFTEPECDLKVIEIRPDSEHIIEDLIEFKFYTLSGRNLFEDGKLGEWTNEIYFSTTNENYWLGCGQYLAGPLLWVIAYFILIGCIIGMLLMSHRIVQNVRSKARRETIVLSDLT